MLVKLFFKFCKNYSNSEVFWHTYSQPYHIGKQNFAPRKKHAWATLSLYKSGTSNLPQVFRHSKINLAIKECFLLNTEIRQSKPSHLFLSCLHVEPLVTADCPHSNSVCWGMVLMQGLGCGRRAGTDRGEERWHRHRPISISARAFLLCWAQSRPGCLSYRLSRGRATQDSNWEDAKLTPFSAALSKGHRKLVLAQRPAFVHLTKGAESATDSFLDTDLGRQRHTAGGRAFTVPSSTPARPGDETQTEPCVRWPACKETNHWRGSGISVQPAQHQQLDGSGPCGFPVFSELCCEKQLCFQKTLSFFLQDASNGTTRLARTGKTVS